jgi:hypothetical protein
VKQDADSGSQNRWVGFVPGLKLIKFFQSFSGETEVKISVGGKKGSL